METKEEVSEVLSMSVDKIVRTNSEKSGPNGTGTLLYGRDAYRQAILQRLIPSLRAFNPDLILLSTGFDPADGDVGNIRNYRSDKDFKTLKGMDLTPEDFAWVTSEIMKIADICCNGRVVSVLEGGYGENNTHKSLKGRAPHTTRQHTRQISSDINSATLSAEHSAVVIIFC